MAESPVKKSPEQKLAEAKEGYESYWAAESAKHANMLRLRAERLARAAAKPAAESAAAKPKARKKIIRKYPG
ncbi:MAG: hypothetical protein KGI99_04515 [Bradyrhizobium sp.]|uniref:hypothetical protein n=1 Tax=Bradyrhizobium sp. TaxID=376 RepID=UPI001C28FAA1|nr:hypothetical protein [Bradyrhizobium sp.]MBU6461337.1 hypothetical protein [Pseudomonadota bacterium]MDE2066512.1 hypothetical protein [Bradyrhizobium sp.]